MPAHKRKEAPGPAAARRRSGRLSAAVKKSSYFDGSDEHEEEDDEDGDDEPLSPPRKRGRRSKKKPLKMQDDEGLYEEEKRSEHDPERENSLGPDEGKDDDDDDEDAPRKVKIIPLEKMRDAGGVEYEDHRLHRNTMLFLRDLKANNKRSWLKAHDGEYRRAWKDWQTFVEATTLTVVDVDDTVPELPVKDVIFRIYRDIRFSKDPTPYKPNFSAAWSRTGRKGPYAVYYIHCEPGNCLVAGGLWYPDKHYVDRLRRSVDLHPARWRRTLNEPLFKKTFLPGVKANASPEAAVKAFVAQNQENALKKRPMGYDITHPDIELLKLRNYTVSTKLDDEGFCMDGVQDKLADILRALRGLVSFLNSIVMPDPNLDEDEEDEEEGGV